MLEDKLAILQELLGESNRRVAHGLKAKYYGPDGSETSAPTMAGPGGVTDPIAEPELYIRDLDDAAVAALLGENAGADELDAESLDEQPYEEPAELGVESELEEDEEALGLEAEDSLY